MKVGLLGHQGKMGKVLTQELAKIGWEVVSLSFDKKILKTELESCQVAIEFSSPKGLELLLEEALIPLVLASTGLEKRLQEKIIEKSLNLPIFYTANYSLGLNKLMLLLKEASLDHSKASISETHHIHKKDAPSGTAIMLKDFLHIQEPIVSLREKEVFGEHEITYNLEGEKLIFTHVALGREVFAQGVLAAAEFIKLKDKGLFSMKDLLCVNNP
jgi:4-hydroxy-tetrahydrodipicolinate reductase